MSERSGEQIEFISTVSHAFIALLESVKNTYPVEDLGRVKPGTVAEALMISLRARGYAIVPVAQAGRVPTREELAEVIGNVRTYPFATYRSSADGGKARNENLAIADAVLTLLGQE